jgi:hypothetical protein
VNLPDRPREGGGALVPRSLSNEQFEMVIRRAAELQARTLEDPAGGAIAEDEVLRIGRELGLSVPHLNRALAEVRSQGPVEETGAIRSLMGPSRVSATRAVPGDVATVRRLIEDYLLGREYLTVFRRLPDRTVYKRAGGVVAAVGRTTSGWFGSPQVLKVEELEVAVEPLEEGSSFVTLGCDMRSKRTEYVAGTAVSSSLAGGLSGLAVATALAPPLAVVGLPVAVAVYAGLRHAYRNELREVSTQLEVLLDRLEYGEISPRSGARR